MFSTNLEFNGNAKAAMDFYAEVFGYEITKNDIWYWEDGREGVAHGEITIYGNRLQFSDVEHAVNYGGFSFSINLINEEELRDRYNKMSVGAEIIMPLGKVEWSACYGFLKDKFGIHWQFNLD